MDTNMCVCVCVCVCVCMCCAILSCYSRVRLFVTVWTVAHQAPLSMGFSRQEYWSGLPRPPPGTFPSQVLNPVSCIFCIVGGFFTTQLPGNPYVCACIHILIHIYHCIFMIFMSIAIIRDLLWPYHCVNIHV